MFTYNEKSRLYYFNPFTFEAPINFELVGAILGIAIYNSVILDVHFPLAVYKKLLGIPANFDDLV